ncbi:MAG: T9SS type A sorting domain-containing protein, partial [Chitinophagales bacterium]
FFCPRNDFLVFEDGPSESLTLQWATYRDASDQCSLSRIWGGIHPPVDDIPGRLIGIEIGVDAFNMAETYFTKTSNPNIISDFNIFPNPTTCALQIEYDLEGVMNLEVYNLNGRLLQSFNLDFSDKRVALNLGDFPSGVYLVVGSDAAGTRLFEEKVVKM